MTGGVERDPMTRERLDAIETRANDATKGPWTLDRAGYVVAPGDTKPQVKAVASLATRSDDVTTDAAFICAARSDVLSLAASLRASWVELDQTRQALRTLVDAWDSEDLQADFSPQAEAARALLKRDSAGA